MRPVSSFIEKIQIRTTEVTRTVVVDITSRLARHNEFTSQQNMRTQTQEEISIISKIFYNSYRKGYHQGCEESRRVNYANGYCDGFRNGKVMGRIQGFATMLVFSFFYQRR